MTTISVTQEQIDEIIRNSIIKVDTLWDKCTVVAANLPSGFIIVESSACVDPANFDAKVGFDICMERIENKIWELEGYKLQCEVASK